MVQRSQIDLRLEKVWIICAEIKLPELIRQQHLAAVGYVEEVSNEAEFRAFANLPRIVCVQIKFGEKWRTAQLAKPESHPHSNRRDAAEIR